MLRLFLHGSISSCTLLKKDCLIFPKGTPDGEISEYAEELLNDYSASYEYLAEYDEEDREMYYENCSFDWIEVFEGNEDFNYHIEEFSMA